ncbi:MAG: tRNA (N6-threonylcarbamoyladenosine(37)-N6)-methyltransferase TrmO [Elusimicrobia bacterium]|nr:tRNA (N6-threonylcarbamoyladenosine(37)-N6)-methyltransferase TrmO [Elusimicrobiota bacterium]
MLRIIGRIESCFREKFGTPRQGALVPESAARLRVSKEFFPEHSLRGLEEFSHVWLLFLFNLNTNKTPPCVVHPPRLRGKTIGVFATRSPHRPTPIGLTLARLVRVEGDVLHLAGVDLVNDTPVLDIKPYIASCDRPGRFRQGWVGRCPAPRLRVEFMKAALADLRRLVPAGRLRRVQAIIAGCLSHDPRNPRDRSQLRPRKELAFFVLHYDVHFRISRGRAVVHRVEAADEAARGRPPLSGSLL